MVSKVSIPHTSHNNTGIKYIHSREYTKRWDKISEGSIPKKQMVTNL